MADKVKLEFGNKSDVGQVRKANEDYFGYYNGSFGELFIVCDGMGGYKGGKVASTTAVDAIKKHFEGMKSGTDLRMELFNSLKLADKEITIKAEEDPELGRMGSTAVVVLINNNHLYFAHIGDSRIYRIRDEEIERLTRDHSLVQEMVDSNIITEDQAEHHPQKNVILRSLGPNGNSEPQVDPRDEVLFKDDYIVLCSDGLTGHVEDREIREIVLKNSPVEACNKLVNLANERGGKDNITVQVIKVTDGKRKAASLKDKQKLMQAAIIGGAALLVIIIWYILGNFNQKNEIPESKETVTTTQDTAKGKKPADTSDQAKKKQEADKKEKAATREGNGN